MIPTQNLKKIERTRRTNFAPRARGGGETPKKRRGVVEKRLEFAFLRHLKTVVGLGTLIIFLELDVIVLFSYSP